MIGVIGLGFVGLTTALGFSEKGTKTCGFDIDAKKLNMIESGTIPFYEPHLDEVLREQLGKNFTIASSLPDLIRDSYIIFICVGTPKGVNGEADLRQIKEALNEIVNVININDSKIILIKSTVPPLTTDNLLNYIRNERKINQINVSLGMNPEFLREGHAWEDFTNPDKIVVGIDTDDMVKEKVKKIYSNFGVAVTFTNTRTAEFLKYLSNTLLSTLISYSNEMSMIAQKISGISIQDAFDLLHKDHRFYGNPAEIASYVYPGCGYGGYCLPKDTEAIISLSKKMGISAPLLEGNLNINKAIIEFWVDQFENEFTNRDINIGILGLSFKPNSDDIRESPAINFIKELKRKGFNNIKGYDPVAMTNFINSYPESHIKLANSSKNLIEESQVIFILTAWEEFRLLNYQGKKLYNLRYIQI